MCPVNRTRLFLHRVHQHADQKWGGADAHGAPWYADYAMIPQAPHLILNSIMASSDRENFNPAYETFRKHSADLLTVIQGPEVIAWELYAENVIPSAVRDAANNTMHERGKRTSDLLAAVDSRIAVDSGAFDVFLYVLAKQPPMSDFCERVKETYRKSVGQAHNFTTRDFNTPSGLSSLVVRGC